MTVTVTLKEVKRPVLPELDDEFVKGLDYDDADELREDVRDQVRREAEHAATEQTNQAMIDAVIAAAPFDLPEDVVAEATKSHIENTKARLRMEGVGGEEFEQQVAEARAATRDKIEREFRMTFLMAAIGKAEKIFVTEREVDDRIAQIAPAYHRTPEAMHAHLEQRDQIGEIRTRMRDEKVVEFLRGKVKIEGEA
jgi:trigger factor